MRLLLCPTQVTSWLKERRIHTCCVLVVSSALSFVLSFVKIIIERSFVPELPFVKPLEQLLFSAVGRGERPVRNELYAASCSALFSALKCYSLYGFLVMEYSLEKA